MKKRIGLTLQALEPRDAPAADLIVTEVRGPVPVAAPGEFVGKVIVKVKNVGDEPARSPAGIKSEIHIFASADLTGSYVDDICIAEQFYDMNIAPNAERVFSIPVTFPMLGSVDAQVPEGKFYWLAFADANRGFGVIPESNNGNNLGFSEVQFDYAYKFGEVGARKNVRLTVATGPHGQEAKTIFSINGPGTGAFSVSGSGADTKLITLTLSNTTAASRVSGFGSLNSRPIRNVIATSPVHSFRAVNVDFEGVLNFAGGLDKLHVRDFVGRSPNASLTVGSGGNPMELILGELEDVNITVNKGVIRFLALAWHDYDTDAVDVLRCDWIGVLEVRENKHSAFEANIELISVRPRTGGVSLGRALFDDLSGLWKINGHVRRVQAYEHVTNWNFWGGQFSNSPGTRLVQMIVEKTIRSSSVIAESIEVFGVRGKATSFTIEAPGGIGALIFKDLWTGGTLTAGNIKLLQAPSIDSVTLNLNGGAGKLLIGQMIASTVNASGQTIVLLRIGDPAASKTSTLPLFRNGSKITAGALAVVRIYDVDEGGPTSFIKADLVGVYVRFKKAVKQAAMSVLGAPDPEADKAGNYTLQIT